jgi:hypothetical protein
MCFCFLSLDNHILMWLITKPVLNGIYSVCNWPKNCKMSMTLSRVEKTNWYMLLSAQKLEHSCMGEFRDMRNPAQVVKKNPAQAAKPRVQDFFLPRVQDFPCPYIRPYRKDIPL